MPQQEEILPSDRLNAIGTRATVSDDVGRTLALARRVINAGLIAPHYQPKVDLRTGSLDGFEALLRWHHPTLGCQLPQSIEAAFHDPALATDLTQRMVGLVISDIRGWLDRGLNFGHVAVNFGAADFRTADFAGALLSQLAASGVPATCLQVEVTETVFLGDGAEEVRRSLATLSKAGVSIALDDFGTGFASLRHLKEFPIDVLKIDRSFIHNLHDDPKDEAIVRAVIGLAKRLKMKVVAEGIETPAQSAYLRKYRCDLGQGYLFAPASDAAGVPALVAAFAERAARLRSEYGHALRLLK